MSDTVNESRWVNMPFRAKGDPRTHVIQQEIAPSMGYPRGALLTHCRCVFHPGDWDAGQTHGKYECATCYVGAENVALRAKVAELERKVAAMQDEISLLEDQTSVTNEGV